MADALKTRAAITHRAADVASREGLEGVTLGRLAEDVGLSKAGVLGHFGTKEALQLAAIEDAVARFREHVWAPAATQPTGRPRLDAIVRAWSAYLTDATFPGGCFLTAASFEFDGREGPVRDRIAGALSQWAATLAREVAAAVRAGDLPPGTDVDQVVFELSATAAGATQASQLHCDPAAAQRCIRGMERALDR